MRALWRDEPGAKSLVLEVAGALDEVEAEGREEVVVAKASVRGREAGRLESAAGELHTAWDDGRGGRDPDAQEASLAILWWPRVGFHLPVTKCVVSVFCILSGSLQMPRYSHTRVFGEGP